MQDKFFGDVAALIALLAHDGKLSAERADALYIENGKRQADAQALADVRTLIAWRKQAPLVRQWLVGSRFAQVHCRLQEQGEDVVAPFYGADEADAMAKAAAWLREQKP